MLDRASAQGLATELYAALAAGDRASLDRLLHPDFEGHATEGLPLDLGGTYHGPDAMRREFWGRIARNFTARAEPAEFSLLDDGRLLVRGRYTGKASTSGAPLEAEFIHLLSFTGGR